LQFRTPYQIVFSVFSKKHLFIQLIPIMKKFADKFLELEGESLTIHLMIPEEVLSVIFVVLHF